MLNIKIKNGKGREHEIETTGFILLTVNDEGVRLDSEMACYAAEALALLASLDKVADAISESMLCDGNGGVLQ